MISRKNMGRKENKQKRNLEKRAQTATTNINDLCPYIYVCKEPWCFDKFGNYRSCERYQHRNPRLDSNDPNYHVDGWREQ